MSAIGHWRPSRRAKTIRSQILLAFLAMSVITASLGYFSVRDLEREGALVDRTFDQSLMSINYARAAAADFNGLQAAVARRSVARDAASSARLDATVAELSATMDDDLSIAVERAESERVIAAAKRVQTAVAVWRAAERQIAAGADSTAWDVLDHQAGVATQQLDLLVNYTAGDGFLYRQSAHATIRSDKRFNIAATILAVLISGSIAYLLSRRVVLPIRKASEIAGKIADGDLGVVVPAGNSDELGALLAAMETMRGAIKASMEREVDLRRAAQSRLGDALESSREGIVVVDADARIALANAQASRLLDTGLEPLGAGDTADRLATSLARMTDSETLDPDYSSTREVELTNGTWLRISHSGTCEGGRIFVYSDISLEKAQEAALKTANLWLDAALKNLTHGLCLFDSANQLKVFNRRFCELFHLPVEQVRQGMTLAELVSLGFGCDSRERSDLFLARVERRIASCEPVDETLELSSGRTLAVSHRPLGEKSWLATYEDVTDRLQAAEKIAYMARHDALTGLPNRAFFAERIEAALADSDRGAGFALLCLDLDHFKEVNDTLGHPIGDHLLRVVADRLKSSIREIDTVARLGGDEFAIVQTKVDGPQEARKLAQRIIEALHVPFEIEGHPVSIGVSIGISIAPMDGRGYDELLKNADMALYQAKADGRDGWRFFDRSMDQRQQARRLIDLDLKEALVLDQFELDYQPVAGVAEARINRLEALVRWRHPVRGRLPPSDFISIAEEMGHIAQIGDWVLQRACRDAASWPADIGVAVNVSAAQLRNGSLHDTVGVALARSGLSPCRLTLEITESVLIANAQNASLVLDRLKGLGIRISMDDFGTGYSSLSYLRSFPFDSVKIDKSFVRDMTAKTEAAAIVRAVIALCGSLNMKTIAEGIETEAQLAFLKAEGCDEAQGFLFSRPIPFDRVLEFLERRSVRADLVAAA